MEVDIVKAHRNWLEHNHRLFRDAETRWWQWRERAVNEGRATAYAYALYEFDKRFAKWDGTEAALLKEHGRMEAVIAAARELVAPNVHGRREYLIDQIADLDAARERTAGDDATGGA
jgi:hypothetical protein